MTIWPHDAHKTNFIKWLKIMFKLSEVVFNKFQNMPGNSLDVYNQIL